MTFLGQEDLAYYVLNNHPIPILHYAIRRMNVFSTTEEYPPVLSVHATPASALIRILAMTPAQRMNV